MSIYIEVISNTGNILQVCYTNVFLNCVLLTIFYYIWRMVTLDYWWSHKSFDALTFKFLLLHENPNLRCALVAFVTVKRLARSRFRLISVALDTPDVSSSTRNDHEKNRLTFWSWYHQVDTGRPRCLRSS